MNTAQASHLGKDPRQYNLVRLFHKQFYRLGHVLVPPTVGFQYGGPICQDTIGLIFKESPFPLKQADLEYT